MDPRTWPAALTVCSLTVTGYLTALGAAFVAVLSSAPFFGETATRDDHLVGAGAAATGLALLLVHALAEAAAGRTAWALLLVPGAGVLALLLIGQLDSASATPDAAGGTVGVWEGVGSALAFGLVSLWPALVIALRLLSRRGTQSRVSLR